MPHNRSIKWKICCSILYSLNLGRRTCKTVSWVILLYYLTVRGRLSEYVVIKSNKNTKQSFSHKIDPKTSKRNRKLHKAIKESSKLSSRSNFLSLLVVFFFKCFSSLDPSTSFWSSKCLQCPLKARFHHQARPQTCIPVLHWQSPPLNRNLKGVGLLSFCPVVRLLHILSSLRKKGSESFPLFG